MEVISHRADREAQRFQASREELVERIAQVVREDSVLEPLKGVHLGRVSVPLEKLHSVLEPSFDLTPV